MKGIAIIGMGPRGLYALENLLTCLSATKQELNIVVYEPSEHPGSGNVWHQQQPDSNWINITERALDGISHRKKVTFGNKVLPEFPSYHSWCNFSQKPNEPDSFPPRNKLGQYLNERFKSIKDALSNSQHFEIIKSDVEFINYTDEKMEVRSGLGSRYFQDVLLTIGHQPTELSNQLKQWNKHAKTASNIKVFESPYPVTQFSDLKQQTNITVGIRGFGLAMIDIMRYLTINNYGNFKVVEPSTFETVYYKTKPQNLKIIPFSLDGLPLAPKPFNEVIDHWYKPTQDELHYFESEVEAIAQTNKAVSSISFLTQPIAKIAARVFIDLKDSAVPNSVSKKELEIIIEKWLIDSDYESSLFKDETLSTYQLIKAYIDMALGKEAISLDYCVWQVWRHCQPTLYKSFSHAKLNDELIEAVIALDERSKRFSYGPPIESMQQMLALVDAEIVSLDFVENPQIDLIENGWSLKNKTNNTMQVYVMLNSVLDAPKLLEVKSKIIKDLLQNDIIQPIHSKLGIKTLEDGYVKTADAVANVPLAVLGRLAKGSVIGVDAILECFGPRIETWAKKYVEKIAG